jgi:type I restriction enzyme M protein
MARNDNNGAASKQGQLGFEAELFKAADKLRGNMEPSDYKHVALGLIFLKYISDAFEARHAQLLAEDTAAAEDKDEYLADNIFWVPKEARWSHLQANARQARIGTLIDDAMRAIEKDNESLKGVLPKDYARPALNKVMLGELIDLISGIALNEGNDKSKDVLGRVYEYFLGQFAGAEGKRGGEFYTPRSVVRTLVEMLEPYQGRVYDPCCGSGRHVRAEREIRRRTRWAHRRHRHLRAGKQLHHLAAGEDEPRRARHRLRHPLEQRRQLPQGRTTRPQGRLHPRQPALQHLRLGWRQIARGRALEFGPPPVGNANYAWLQHIFHHLAPHGFAGVVLANGSMSSQQSGEGEIRRAMIEAGAVDCMVALPGQLFYSTQIPACLWILAKDRSNGLVKKTKLRDRRGEVLFIDARKLGALVDRTRRELTDTEIAKIAATYHAWRGEADAGEYSDIPGFCKSATLDEIRKHGHVLTPGRYVGTEVQDEDDEAFDEKMRRLTAQLAEQMARGAELDAVIRDKLAGLGYGASTS